MAANSEENFNTSPQPYLTLYLWRHCKSDWSDHSLSDKNRPLNARGKQAAQDIGRFLANSTHAIHPDVILCSSAVRTRQSLDILQNSMLDNGSNQLKNIPLTYHDSLYLADAATIWQHIMHHRYYLGHEKIMVIGHNPGLHDLALSLCRQCHMAHASQNEIYQDICHKFPTGALLDIRIPMPADKNYDWTIPLSNKTANSQYAVINQFIVPRRIAQTSS